MKLIPFLENTFQELKVEEAKTDAFNISVDSKMKASHEVLTLFRWVYKWLMVPRLFIEFVLVNLGLKREPVPIILNKIREDKLAKQAAEKLLAASKVTSIGQNTNQSEPSPTAG